MLLLAIYGTFALGLVMFLLCLLFCEEKLDGWVGMFVRICFAIGSIQAVIFMAIITNMMSDVIEVIVGSTVTVGMCLIAIISLAPEGMSDLLSTCRQFYKKYRSGIC